MGIKSHIFQTRQLRILNLEYQHLFSTSHLLCRRGTQGIPKESYSGALVLRCSGSPGEVQQICRKQKPVFTTAAFSKLRSALRFFCENIGGFPIKIKTKIRHVQFVVILWKYRDLCKKNRTDILLQCIFIVNFLDFYNSLG